MADTVRQHMGSAAASVSDIVISAAAVDAVVVAQWPLAAQPVNAADKPGIQLSVASSAPVFVQSAFAEACPVRAPADELSHDVVLASRLKTHVPHALGQVSLEAPRT